MKNNLSLPLVILELVGSVIAGSLAPGSSCEVLAIYLDKTNMKSVPVERCLKKTANIFACNTACDMVGSYYLSFCLSDVDQSDYLST